MKEDFAALREHDQKNAPSFDEMTRARPPARSVSPLVFILPGAAVFAAAAAFVIFIATRPQAEPPRAAAVAATPQPDPEPLGFLLDEPATLARFTDFDQERR